LISTPLSACILMSAYKTLEVRLSNLSRAAFLSSKRWRTTVPLPKVSLGAETLAFVLISVFSRLFSSFLISEYLRSKLAVVGKVLKLHACLKRTFYIKINYTTHFFLIVIYNIFSIMKLTNFMNISEKSQENFTNLGKKNTSNGFGNFLTIKIKLPINPSPDKSNFFNFYSKNKF
jgi:hypothetical protein